jgi:hypothetical protein
MNPFPSSNPALPTGSDLRRKARLVFASFLFLDLLLVLGIWGERLGLSDSLANILLGAALLGGVLIVGIGLEPFRRMELRQNAEKPGNVRWTQLALFLAVPLAVCVPVLHYVTREPWRLSIARAVGLGMYFLIFMVLARVQRRGVAPYLRPAWYGFFLAGITAVLVWSVAAGESVTEGLATALAGPLLHYAYVRWTTRDAGPAYADGGLAGDGPTR